MIEHAILFVCTGNTCRSPMAEGLACMLLAKRRGVAPDALKSVGIRVQSAGVYAAPGSPATPEAVAAVSAIGADIANHSARLLSLDDVQDADVIYVMTQGHGQAVLSLAPHASDKLLCLDAQGDIIDPIGAGPEVYDSTAKMIEAAIALRLDERFGESNIV